MRCTGLLKRRRYGSVPKFSDWFAVALSVNASATHGKATDDAFTVTLMLALPTSPLSLTDAVMRWLPGERLDAANEPPLPITPSRSETQESCAVMVPFRPVAVPVNVTACPMSTVVPVAGAVMLTCGACVCAAAVIETMIELELESPFVSTPVAVITCVPRARFEVTRFGPVPSAPFRLDDHLIVALTSPSVVSIAEALKLIGVPAGTLNPFAGCVMVSVGGVLPMPIVIVW